MKTKDQTLLEEAYDNIWNFNVLNKEKESKLKSIEYLESLLQKSLNMAKNFTEEEGGYKAAMEDVKKIQSFIDKDKHDLEKLLDQIKKVKLQDSVLY